MSDERLTPERPDLSALDWSTRVCVALAESQGAAWERCANANVLRWTDPPRHSVALAYDDGRLDAFPPSYLTDPAAWGALLRDELCGIHQSGPNGPWKAQWWEDGKIRLGAIREKIEEAVVFAVLAKADHPDLMALLLESRP